MRKTLLYKIIKYLFFMIIGGICLFLCFLGLDRFFPLPLHDVQSTQVVVAQDGTPLWRFADKEGIWRYSVTLDEVAQTYIDVLLTYEDRYFYQHWGVNPFSIVRAAWQLITNQRIVSGGSTLTMQVARLIDPHEKTLLGKMKQLFRSLQLEWHYSKKEILTLYINRAPFGGTLQGIGAASWAYLSKPPSQLTLGESALLAVLPQMPSRLRPDRYPQRAKIARNKVLQRLEQFNVWPPEQITAIQEEDIWLAPRHNPQLAPLLARRLRYVYHDDIIKTTLDASLQQSIENIALNWKTQLPKKTSLGILVVDHTDMAVKSYVGSADFNDDMRFGQVDMLKALRSPGSTLKPFLFGFTLDDGLIHSASLLQDVPRITSDYRPTNFDADFNGPVSAADSLSRSLNLPSVQLMDIYGAKRFAAKLRHVGLVLRSKGNDEPNLSFILGGAATRMDQLVAAYSAFARQGKSAQLRFTPNDPLIERQLMSPGAAWIVRRILAGERPSLASGNISNVAPFAWKTGTSYGYRDAWAIGINERYIIGVWVGRPDATPVAGQYGNATAVPLLMQVNTLLLQRQRQASVLSPTDLRPNTVTAMDICWPLGQPLLEDDPNCHRRLRAWTLEKMTPLTLPSSPNSNLESGKKIIWLNDKGLRVAPDCTPAQRQEIAVWPLALEAWIRPQERRAALMPAVDPTCPIIGEDIAPPLIINNLIDNQIVTPLPQQTSVTLQVSSQGGRGVRWWFLNGELQSTAQEDDPVEVTIQKKGSYQLLLLDESGQIARRIFRFN